MKNIGKISILLTLVFAQVSQAEVYSCTFAKPAFKLDIDRSTGVGVKLESDKKSPDTNFIKTTTVEGLRIAESMIGGKETLFVIGSNGKGIAKLTAVDSKKVSTSSKKFGYEVELINTGKVKVIGGCERL